VGILPWYVTSHRIVQQESVNCQLKGTVEQQLMPLVGQVLSISQISVMLYGWEGEGNYGLFHTWINAWLAGKQIPH